MTPRTAVLAAALAASLAVPATASRARADDAPAPAASGSPSDYDDAAMHFTAPPGFERIPVPGGAPGADAGGDSDDPRPVAVWVKDRGKDDQRTIVISIGTFDGSLANFDTSHESELRKAVSSTFVSKKTNLTLANGMPAVFLKINQGDSLQTFVRRDEYLVVDGTRSIDVAYIGRQGDFDEAQAMDALKSLSVVLYPRHRV